MALYSGTLIEAWASLKSFRPKEDDDDDSHRRDGDGTRGSDKNPWMNFNGEKRKNDTRESPEALAVAVLTVGYGTQPGNAAACFTHVAICAH